MEFFILFLVVICVAFYVTKKLIVKEKHKPISGEREYYLNRIETLNREHSLRIEENNANHNQNLQRIIQDLKELHERDLKEKLEKTRVQTRAVNFGNHAQHTIIPLLAADKAGISNKEIRWFGDSIDFICFKGLEEEDGEVEIIFADSKTSKSVKEVLENKDKWSTHKTYSPYKFLNKRQKRIVDAIRNNRVNFQLWLADEEGTFDVAEFGNKKTII